LILPCWPLKLKLPLKPVVPKHSVRWVPNSFSALRLGGPQRELRALGV
jgi:hypothetical protein